MEQNLDFLEQIRELIRANGWEMLLEVELIVQNSDQSSGATQPLSGGGGAQSGIVRVKLGKGHSSAPLEIVNDYVPGVHPLEQVQQECLRALRTGRPGI